MSYPQEAGDIAELFDRFVKSEEPFDKRFRDRIPVEGHGMDVLNPPPVNEVTSPASHDLLSFGTPCERGESGLHAGDHSRAKPIRISWNLRFADCLYLGVRARDSI